VGSSVPMGSVIDLLVDYADIFVMIEPLRRALFRWLGHSYRERQGSIEGPSVKRTEVDPLEGDYRGEISRRRAVDPSGQ
jgi:hypothetical protein